MARKMSVWLVMMIMTLAGCEQTTAPDDPSAIGSGDAAKMQLRLVVPTDLNIDHGEVTITKGALVHSQTFDLVDGTATVLFADLQPGIWQIAVALYDADGFLLYEGAGEAAIHDGQTTSAHIVLTELSGDLEILIELPPEAEVLFEDRFTDGMSPEWVSVKPAQWVADGWLYTQADGSYGRDSYAFVHDGDAAWTDLTLSIVVDPLPVAGFDRDRGEVYFRTSDIGPTMYQPSGNYYRLFLQAPADDPQEPNTLGLTRYRDSQGSVTLYDGFSPLGHDPGLVEITLAGPLIRIAIDGVEVVDLVDPDPLLFGGVGVGAIWECLCRFDDVVVTATAGVTD